MSVLSIDIEPRMPEPPLLLVEIEEPAEPEPQQKAVALDGA